MTLTAKGGLEVSLPKKKISYMVKICFLYDFIIVKIYNSNKVPMSNCVPTNAEWTKTNILI